MTRAPRKSPANRALDEQILRRGLEDFSFCSPAGLVVGFSGGADSLGLALLLVRRRWRRDIPVRLLHIDHRLRPESAAHAAAAVALAARVGLPCDVRVIHPADLAGHRGVGVEEAARRERYRLLASALEPGEALALAHHADDQAETVLMNLLRGAGVSGIAGMRADGRRPMLGLRRSDTVSLCEVLAVDPGVQVVHDPSNDDPRHLRNRVRHELLPLMAELSQRDPVPVLARQAVLAGHESDFLDIAALAIDPTDARQVASAPAVLARRAVRRWLTVEHPPDAASVERVLAVARGEALGTDVGAGRRVTRHAQRLVLRPEADPRASE